MNRRTRKWTFTEVQVGSPCNQKAGTIENSRAADPGRHGGCINCR